MLSSSGAQESSETNCSITIKNEPVYVAEEINFTGQCRKREEMKEATPCQVVQEDRDQTGIFGEPSGPKG